MEDHLNFKDFGNVPPGNSGRDGGNKSPGNFPLTRQSSIYSLTFDEFQSSLNKDFGSMNMDELLKTIWSAEETQSTAFTSGGGGAHAGTADAVQNGLQRQGSLTLPRTLSLKTVDEVWRELSKEQTAAGKEGAGGSNDLDMPQRQQTLGEITLEEFLLRAGVVTEENLIAGNANNSGFFGNTSNAALPTGFQQDSSRVSNFMGDAGQDIPNQVSIQPSNLPLNVNSVTLNQQQQQILPNQTAFGYGTQQVAIKGNTQLGNPSIRSGIVGIRDQGLGNNTSLVQNAVFEGGGYGLAGGLQAVVTTGSPVTPLSSDGIGTSNGDTSSVSPVPYTFGGGFRGRRSNAVEKAAERRQRRMIKNRESAARSRARKQAYTVELEAEIAKLKAENEELKRKLAEMMEQQKNQQQASEIMNLQGEPKKRLRRNLSGPW